MSTECDTPIEKLKEKTRELCTRKRYEHILSVEKLSLKLGKIYALDREELAVSALAHDMFRDLKGSELLEMASSYALEVTPLECGAPVLLHGKLAACYLRREFKVSESVFEAVYWHVGGKLGISKLGKVLMVADMLEENRIFPGIEELRELAEVDLEKSFLNVIKLKMLWALNTDRFLLPETVSVWNNYLGGACYVSN